MQTPPGLALYTTLSHLGLTPVKFYTWNFFENFTLAGRLYQSVFYFLKALVIENTQLLDAHEGATGLPLALE
jgi:hypothetical protein